MVTGAGTTVADVARSLQSRGMSRVTGSSALVACSLFATAGLYLGLAYALSGELGYPLDDAWIHQTYARNLAKFGQWAFIPGHPSAGSTSPLWTIVLAIAYRLPVDPRLWTYGAGLFALLGTAWATARLSLAIFDDAGLARLTGAAVLVEWHLAWSALSGMEILLYTLLATLLLGAMLSRHSTPRPFFWGLLGGLLVLARPEGLWLVGIAGVVLVLRTWKEPRRRQASGLAQYGAGCSLLIAPYLALNWEITDRLFPTTFYAKQAEYRILIETIPLWRRFFTQAWLPWIGGQALFLLGIGWVILTGRARLARLISPAAARQLVPGLWALGVIAVYALRLPVTYQHGRYLMPVIPIVLLYGMGSFRRLVAGVPRVLSRALVISAALLFLLFWARGGVAYAQDTAIITCEMVDTARYLSTETSPSDFIAAHDIGALGYFANRPLLDLAGLISPEIVPFLRDENALLHLMRARGVTHVVFFPAWYPVIAADPDLQLLYRPDCPTTRAAGEESLAVYITKWSSDD